MRAYGIPGVGCHECSSPNRRRAIGALCPTTRSRRWWHHVRSAGSRTWTCKGRSIWRHTASSTQSANTRRCSPSRVTAPRIRRPSLETCTSSCGIWSLSTCAKRRMRPRPRYHAARASSIAPGSVPLRPHSAAVPRSEPGRADVGRRSLGLSRRKQRGAARRGGLSRPFVCLKGATRTPQPLAGP